MCIGLGKIMTDKTRIWTHAPRISSQVVSQSNYMALVIKWVWPLTKWTPLKWFLPSKINIPKVNSFPGRSQPVSSRGWHIMKCNRMVEIMRDQTGCYYLNMTICPWFKNASTPSILSYIVICNFLSIFILQGILDIKYALYVYIHFKLCTCVCYNMYQYKSGKKNLSSCLVIS